MIIKQPVTFATSTAAAALLLAAAACSPKVETNGYVKFEDIKEQIAVGQSTKDDVQAKLGSPSAQSSFGNDAWYYITDRKEALAFMKYEVVDQEVTRVEFDESGVVARVDNFDESQAAEFPIVKRETATEGHTLGFFEQMLGNIGRFNAPGGRGPGAVPGRRGAR